MLKPYEPTEFVQQVRLLLPLQFMQPYPKYLIVNPHGKPEAFTTLDLAIQASKKHSRVQFMEICGITPNGCIVRVMQPEETGFKPAKIEGFNKL